MKSNEYDYDHIEAGYYDSIYRKCRGMQSKWHILKFARMRREMGRFNRHLDIGCGSGTLIGSMDDNGFSVGVDIAKGQIAYAQKVYNGPNKHFLTIDPGRLPFLDATFDRITVIEVIEHLSRQQGLVLLTEAHRILQPGGGVYC